MKVLDLFSGCGGLSLGFEQAGFEIYGGIDNNPDAVNTFQHNFPKSIALKQDLEKADFSEISKLMPDIQDVEALIGGPPCQGFSAANRWTHETDEQRNRLFFAFVEFVDRIKPKVVVIENVQQIITRDGGYAKDRIYEIFQERGYFVNHQILNSSDFNVPQNRKRNFFVITEDIEFDFNSIEEFQRTPTVGEALSELYSLEVHENQDTHVLQGKPSTKYQRYLRARNNKITNHEIRYPAPEVQERISHVPQGSNWRSVPEHLWPRVRNNRHSSAYRRLHEGKPSCTIDTGNTHSNYFHPKFDRLPSPREAARIQSFPDNFHFVGTRTPQYIQVGNAVPPLMAKALAQAISGAFQ